MLRPHISKTSFSRKTESTTRGTLRRVLRFGGPRQADGVVRSSSALRQRLRRAPVRSLRERGEDGVTVHGIGAEVSFARHRRGDGVVATA